jgi:hypothetical protein
MSHALPTFHNCFSRAYRAVPGGEIGDTPARSSGEDTMTPDGSLPAESAPGATRDAWDLSSSRSVRSVERTPPFDKDLSREFVARQRGLAREIKEVIGLTRKIVDSTLEQLQSFCFLGGISRSAERLENDTTDSP